MLRDAVLAIGVLSLGGGAICLAVGPWPAAIMPICFGALLLLGTLWEKVRYKPLESARPGPGWIATDERFVDDETGRSVRVWLEPKSGERRYVTE